MNDTTLAVAGIAGTLIGALAAPLITAWITDRKDRQRNIWELRKTTYIDILAYVEAVERKIDLVTYEYYRGATIDSHALETFQKSPPVDHVTSRLIQTDRSADLVVLWRDIVRANDNLYEYMIERHSTGESFGDVFPLSVTDEWVVSMRADIEKIRKYCSIS